jgi:hypothetical protein
MLVDMFPEQIPWGITVTTIIATVLLSTIGLGYLLLGWLRKRSWRVLLRGAGFVLMPIGFFLLGGMDAAYRGVNSLFTWANSTYLGAKLLIAIIVFGLGILLYVVGSCWPQVLGDEAKSRRATIAERRAAKKAGIASAPGGATGTGAGAPAAVPGPNGTLALTPGTTLPTPAGQPTSSLEPDSATEDEIDAILRRHGIQ